MVSVLHQFLTANEIEQLRKMSRKLFFEDGRQGTGYSKAAIPPEMFAGLRHRSMTVMGSELDVSHDCYLLRYPPGSYIPEHLDDALFGCQHRRLNAIVSSARGGDLTVDGRGIPLQCRDAYHFRPDLQKHSVSHVTCGVRLVWSVGFLAPEKS